MLFAEMTEGLWIALIGLVAGIGANMAAIFVAYFAFKSSIAKMKEESEQRAEKARLAQEAAALEVKRAVAVVAEKTAADAVEVKQAVAVVAQKAEAVGLVNENVIASIKDAQSEQHKLMNSRLDEMKRIITEKAYAEGVLQGKSELKAEQDAKAVAIAEAKASIAQGPQTAPPSLVQVVPPVTPAPPILVEIAPPKEPAPPLDVNIIPGKTVPVEIKEKPEKKG